MRLRITVHSRRALLRFGGEEGEEGGAHGQVKMVDVQVQDDVLHLQKTEIPGHTVSGAACCRRSSSLTTTTTTMMMITLAFTHSTAIAILLNKIYKLYKLYNTYLYPNHTGHSASILLVRSLPWVVNVRASSRRRC